MLKQVIIVRKDLNMRKGKMIAQGAHASLTAAFAAVNNYRIALFFRGYLMKNHVVEPDGWLCELYKPR